MNDLERWLLYALGVRAGLVDESEVPDGAKTHPETAAAIAAAESEQAAASPAAPDPRDAEIAALRAQLAAQSSPGSSAQETTSSGTPLGGDQ